MILLIARPLAGLDPAIGEVVDEGKGNLRAKGPPSVEELDSL